MSAAGTLALGTPDTFAPTMDGFGEGDLIDLLQTAVTNLSYADDTLTVTNGGAMVASLNLVGDYSTPDFVFSSDNSDGTDIELVTLSITPTDPSAVDSPESEDFTVTLDGDISQAQTVYASTTDGTTVPGEDRQFR